MKRLQNVRAIFILAYMFSILWVVRNLLSLIYLFFAPFTVLFLLYAMVGSEVLPYALVGAYIMTIVQAGSDIVGDAAWHKLELKFQDMIVASPVSETAYMLAEALSELLYASPALVILSIFIYQIKPSLVTLGTIFSITLTALAFNIGTWLLHINLYAQLKECVADLSAPRVHTSRASTSLLPNRASTRASILASVRTTNYTRRHNIKRVRRPNIYHECSL
jgi:ABC-2 type transport system permease protein